MANINFCTQAVLLRCFLKKVFSKNLTKLTGKHLPSNLLFKKDSGLIPATLSKKILQQRCFPENFAKFSRTPFLQKASRRLFLFVVHLVVSFCKDVSYICSNIDKNSQLCHLFILQLHFILYIVNLFSYFRVFNYAL